MRAFWRALAVLTALPMIFATAFVPDWWPLWVFGWGTFVALGFG